MKVTISPEAQEQSLKLPISVRIRLKDVVERLEKWPHVSGVKWLTADWKGFARIRTGDYRVIFRLAGNIIEVVRIADRRDVYAD